MNIFFAVYLKDSSFRPSTEVKPMSNYRVNVVPWLSMFALCVYTTISMDEVPYYKRMTIMG
jgi:hypothetical protein